MTTQKEYNRRLLVLADFLEALPPEKFDFKSWVGDSWKGKPDLSCGTTACALGWATTIPEFRDLGLRLFIDGAGIGAYVSLEHDDSGRPSYAAFVVFGLDYAGYNRLFIPARHQQNGCLTSDATAIDVATNIRKYVSERKLYA